MTRAEFDGWIEQHYGELVGVARRRTNSLDEAQDAVQAAVVGMLGSAAFMAARVAYAWPRAVKFVTACAHNQRVSASSYRRLKTEQKIFQRASSLHGRGGTK